MAIRSGIDYINGLRDGREVWIGGERVKDVTTHPALKHGVESIANLYDMQHDPKYRDILTYESPVTGERVGMSFLAPKSVEDLIRRRNACRLWADATHGMMGRSPDFLNTTLMVLASYPEYFNQCDPRFGQNIVEYYQYVRENDLSLTHAIVDPQIDRSKQPHEQADPYTYLGVVRETSDGLILRGAKMLATLAPYTDEVIVYPFPNLRKGDEKYAAAFAIPLNTSGLKIICREPLDLSRGLIDHPLGGRFDEMDAVLIFDDVLVPWERVFLKGNVDLSTRMQIALHLPTFTAHQTSIRALAKTDFLLGIAFLIAEYIDIKDFLHVQEKLGEMITMRETINACIRASESDAVYLKNGLIRPSDQALQAVRIWFPKFYPRMIEILQLIGAGGLMMTPSQHDLSGIMSEDIKKYYRGAHVSAEDRIGLFKLAWDLVGDGFGSRQLLYERYYAGDPVRLTARSYLTYDREPYMDIVRDFLDETRQLQYRRESNLRAAK